MFGCKHSFDKVKEDGYQYCSKCGIASAPPPKECHHQWNHINTFEVSNVFSRSGPHTIRYHMRCADCGDIKSVDL